MRAPAIESATGLHPVSSPKNQEQGTNNPKLSAFPTLNHRQQQQTTANGLLSRLPPIQLSKKIEAKKKQPTGQEPET